MESSSHGGGTMGVLLVVEVKVAAGHHSNV